MVTFSGFKRQQLRLRIHIFVSPTFISTIWFSRLEFFYTLYTRNYVLGPLWCYAGCIFNTMDEAWRMKTWCSTKVCSVKSTQYTQPLPDRQLIRLLKVFLIFKAVKTKSTVNQFLYRFWNQSDDGNRYASIIIIAFTHSLMAFEIDEMVWLHVIIKCE